MRFQSVNTPFKFLRRNLDGALIKRISCSDIRVALPVLTLLRYQ